MPFMMLVYLLLTACDKDDVLPARPMEWSYEIITPANVQFLKSTTDVSPSYFFETNGKGGDMVMTCENYETLSKILCKWKQDSVVSLFLYLNSVFKHKHKLIHNQAPV